MTDDQIKHMVDRFLNWKLPENFSPDAGISFKPTFNEHTDHPMRHEPSGTNLLNFKQADAMVRNMLQGIRHSPEFAWLIETDGPHYLCLTRIGGTPSFEWTRDANKAMRFSRNVDADAAIDGLRALQPHLFAFPTGTMPKPVEHGWTELPRDRDAISEPQT